MEESDCCTADRWNDTDICSDCKEHADFSEETEQEVDMVCRRCKDDEGYGRIKLCNSCRDDMRS